MKLLPTIYSSIQINEDACYCPTLLIAWNELKKLVKKDEILTTGHLYVQELNFSEFSIDILNDKDYIAKAGFCPQIIGDIEKEMEQKFGKITVNLRGETSQYIVFSYLYKLLKFPSPFFVHEEPLLFNNTLVNNFGFTNYTTNFIKVWKDQEKCSFQVNTEDSIIFFTKIPYLNNLKSLLSIAESVRKDSNYLPYPQIGKVSIPYISFEKLVEFSEIEGPIINCPLFTIDSVIQYVKFLLDEFGVELESYSIIRGTGSLFIEPARYNILFDSPFLIEIYSKKDKMLTDPYFVSYITTTETMRRFNNE
jgi:hypothetical protein